NALSFPASVLIEERATDRSRFCVTCRRLYALLVLSRFSSGLFRAMFAMKEIENGKEIHRRVSA
ncbi:MAG: hypothetical protein RMX60_12115, partial [Planktomarina sp.]|nr:hypothetical protein [Planktomarina sp.]